MRVSSKSRTESLSIGGVRTTFTWQGSSSNKPVVTYSCVPHKVPLEGTLDSVVTLRDTKALPEVETTLTTYQRGNSRDM